MDAKRSVLFGYQGSFELDREQEKSFEDTYPACAFSFGRPDSFSEEALANAEIMIGMFNKPQMEKAKRLKWLQACTVGTDRYAGLVDLEKTIVTNSRDLFNKCMGEHAFAMMIAWSRSITLQRDSQLKREWKGHAVSIDLFESTLGIVGLGGIGADVAQKAKAFGMKVIAIRRNLNNKPDYVDELYPLSQLDVLLSQSDVLLLAIPLIGETYHLIGKAQLEKMKPTAYLLNVARGKVVDTDALIEALQNKTIAGAGLDTTSPEPLNSDSPLWTMPNVLITPHVANRSPSTNRFRYEFYFENMRRYLAGEELLNRVADLTV